MRTTVRRLRAERRLFEVHAHLAHARQEAALLAGQHADLVHLAEAAHARMLAAETARAQRAFEEARGRVAVASASLVAARALVDELERAQDDALDELLGPEA